MKEKSAAEKFSLFQHCTQFDISRILVCNNSHGDASIAYTDSDYDLTAVIRRNGEDFTIIDENLNSFF